MKELEYTAIYAGKSVTFTAESLYHAKMVAIEELHVPKHKDGLLSVMLTAKDGEPVIHTPDF